MTLFKSITKLFPNVATMSRLLSTSTPKTAAAVNSFRFEDLQLDLHKTMPSLPDDPSKLIFGHKFTDHMLSIDWTTKDGWSKPVIGPLRNLEIHPAAKVLHYAVEVFEGMKAYKGVDGKVRLFRPDLNLARLHKSTLRSALPEFDKEEFFKCLKQLVSLEKDWVPQAMSTSLYIRPTFIGTDPTLDMSATNSAKLYVILSPTGPYFSSFKAITLLADNKYTRAFPGGVGNFKMGSNYGPAIFVSMEAQRQGCQQVLWLFGDEEYITEAGVMNVFVVIKNDKGQTELITPPLDGTILEGVTRQSILDLAKKWGKIEVSERPMRMNELLDLLQKNRLLEMFGSGTACVVCPIEALVYKGKRLQIPTLTKDAPVMSRFSNELNDIQYGRTKHDWATIVD